MLLSVKKTSDGSFYLPKYEYQTIAKTIDGNWAFRGNDIRGNKILMKSATFEPILFEDEFSYIIKNSKKLRKRFPRKYYKKEKDKMIPVKGVYINTIVK